MIARRLRDKLARGKPITIENFVIATIDKCISQTGQSISQSVSQSVSQSINQLSNYSISDSNSNSKSKGAFLWGDPSIS